MTIKVSRGIGVSMVIRPRTGINPPSPGGRDPSLEGEGGGIFSLPHKGEGITNEVSLVMFAIAPQGE